MASPCIDVCRYDEATGWCLGCGMTRKDKKHWKKEKERRPEIRAVLPGRLAELAMAGEVTGKAAGKKKKKHRQEAATPDPVG
ncbi:DUF1289 domain-containing protein [Roseicella sp. DB1501]|uniref:DUF1289 domain-containing protein n=1 Tax=Roseicella sp. DB1501 TaxID=2730925 RepID=UPI001491E700|nr:DUF1289 domain-containing protein [Roseicella sp. DB1501]NOG69056.1 DUF1289 domain-containing protein [Roseicella sp. DB1501]